MNDISQKDNLQRRYYELEKQFQSLENENNLLKYELNQKAEILSKVTKELSQIQIQYKQSVDKIVELSSKKAENNFSLSDQVYQKQLRNQAQVIDSLQNRLWCSDYLNCLENYDRFHVNRNENIQKYIDHQNYINEKNYQTDKKIKYYENYISQLKKEIKKWKSFAIRIFDISADALDVEPEFPRHDSKIQRQITIELVEQLAKQKADDTQIQRKYQMLQDRYNNLSQYLNRVKFQCNKLTEKTQNCIHSDSFNRMGEISRIEEFVTQENYHNEPASLRNPQKKKKPFSFDIESEDDTSENKQIEAEEESKNYSDISPRTNHATSSFSSFDNSFESIKNLVKSFSKEYKKENKSKNKNTSQELNSPKKKVQIPSIDNFSFESH